MSTASVDNTSQSRQHSDAPITAETPRNGSGSPPIAATILRRACDCCRKRKVKCDGGDPCGPCKKASIRCAYLQTPKKKGPKGLRSARVLHALRRIDGSLSAQLNAPAHHDRAALPGSQSWPLLDSARDHAPSSEPAQGHQFQSQSRPVARPTTHPSIRPQHWSDYAPPNNTSNDGRLHPATSSSSMHTQRLPGPAFIPYMRLFYTHMFPIMPVIDRAIYLNTSYYSDSSAWTSSEYSFLCAICAATIVQLDASISQPAALHPTMATEDFLVEQCLQERKTFDYIEPASALSAMTSFFLFAYYGNRENQTKAWHYLQECITFAENLNMDVEESYAKLDPTEAQWRRRLYWLIFITERAYAVQRRKHTRLHAGIVGLPAVFESEDHQLLTGFVNLANLFSAVGDDFVRAWRGSMHASLCDAAWLAETQKRLDAAALALENISETQQLDISVTREWLHVLAWQMGVSNGLMWGRGDGGMRLDYPVELARKVVGITSGADATALDSHGIGMEQKLSDIAGCLADVLRCTAGDTSSTFFEGRQYLNVLLHQLSSMRGKESRYLKPLMAKMQGVLGYELSTQSLPLPAEAADGRTEMSAAGMMPGVGSAGWLNWQRAVMGDMGEGGALRRGGRPTALGMEILDVELERAHQSLETGRVLGEDGPGWDEHGVA